MLTATLLTLLVVRLILLVAIKIKPRYKFPILRKLSKIVSPLRHSTTKWRKRTASFRNFFFTKKST